MQHIKAGTPVFSGKDWQSSALLSTTYILHNEDNVKYNYLPPRFALFALVVSYFVHVHVHF